MKRTYLALLLVFTMVLLAACGGGESGASGIDKETVNESLYSAIIPDGCETAPLNTEVQGFHITGKIYGYDEDDIFFMLLHGDYTAMISGLNIATASVEKATLNSALSGSGVVEFEEGEKGKLGNMDAYVYPITEANGEDVKGYAHGFLTEEGHMILMIYAGEDGAYNQSDYKTFVDGFNWKGGVASIPAGDDQNNNGDQGGQSAASGDLALKSFTRDYVKAMVPADAESQTQTVESNGYKIPCEFIVCPLMDGDDVSGYYMMIYSDYGSMIRGLSKEYDMDAEDIVDATEESAISGVLSGMGHFTAGTAKKGELGGEDAYVYPITAFDGNAVVGEARGFMEDNGESLIVIYCDAEGAYSADLMQKLMSIDWND